MTPDLELVDCSVARTLEVVGERWSLLILRDAFYGVRRFDDFQYDLGVARNILSDRLRKLVAQGVLERSRYADRPPRYEYRLTTKGRELLPVLLSLMHWGDKWSRPEAESPVRMIHTACGKATHPVFTCAHCAKEIVARDLAIEPNPIRRRDAVSA